MNSLCNWKAIFLLASSVFFVSCTDPYGGGYRGSNSYSYFYFEDGSAFCDDVQHDFDESIMTNFECVEPVYLSLNEFRDSDNVNLVDPKAINAAGKVYGYNDMLFTIDHANGIGIWSLNLGQTTQTGYITLNGVTDISIRNDYLYGNSYMDLVQINLSDMAAKPVRLKDMFEFKREDVIARLPDSTYFYRTMVDDDKGIIVGYKKFESTNTVLFGE